MLSAEEQTFERTTERLRPGPEQPAGGAREACLIRIYPTGPGMGRRYPLGDAALVIGRGCDCDVRIDDHSVSRRHARVEPAAGGYHAIDLASTNGTHVNNVPALRQELRDGDYLRVGNHIFRFLTGGNVEADYHEEIHRLAVIDALTGIPNRRHLLEFLDRELARSARHARPLALILFDLDRFKAINDERGHLCGDYVLRELAACVEPVVRAEELFARYGGEEFVVVLPECTPEAGRVVAERLRGLVEKHPFQFEGRPVVVTVSLGAAATTGLDSASAEGLLRRADEKLYEAKRGGRNRVAV